MKVAPGRAGRLALIGALVGMTAAIAAPQLGDLSAGPTPSDPVETTEVVAPDTTVAEVTVDGSVTPTTTTPPPPETSTPSADGAADTVATTTEAPSETTEPEPAPDVATDSTAPDGAVGPTGAGDTYGVTVVAVCVGGNTPVVDFTSTSTADILVTVGGEPNWSTVLAPAGHAQGTWPTTERGDDTVAKWDAQSVEPDGWTDFGSVELPADCPPPPNTPSAPQNFSTTADDGSVALSWSPPSSNGGSAITDYVVEYNAYPVDDPWTTVNDGGATSGLVIGGLNNCVTYLFRVRADNVNGPGEWIDGKDTPARVPCAPPAPSATNINGQIFLEWSEPPSGSNPVTDYTIEYDAHPVDGVWTPVTDGVSANTSYTVGGLTLGTRYSFRVKARNVIGVGAPSAVVEAVPQSVPTAPRSLTATPTNLSGQIRLDWVAPLSTGGSPITDYVVQRSPNGSSSWTDWPDGVNVNRTYTVTGLTNGVRYYFRVLARNALGDSVASNVVNAIPRTVPTAPRSLTAAATGVAGQVRLSWLAPSSAGGSAILDYIVQRSPSGLAGTWATISDGVNTNTAFTVTGLATGTRYYFRVFAKNAAGNSPSSNVVNAVPTAGLSAPRSLTASPTNLSGQIRLTWLAPLSTGGAAITDYVIQRSPSGNPGTWATISDGVSTARAFTVTGLSNGVRYYFRVFARTSRATSPASNTASAVPRTVPSAPRSLVAAPNNLSGRIRLTWSAPSSTGGAAITDYVIQRSFNGSTSWTTIADGVNIATAYTVTGLSNGVRYYFRVFAKNAAGFSPPSAVANAVPGVPGRVSFLAVDATFEGFDFFWGDPVTSGGFPLTGFVFHEFFDGSWHYLDTVDPSWRDAFLEAPGEGCGTFRVAAQNVIGIGAFTNAVTACWP